MKKHTNAALPIRPLDSEEEFGLGDLSVNLCRKLDESEYETLRIITCDPLRTIPVAEAAGIGPHDFTNRDLQLIYCAADVTRGHASSVFYSLALKALEVEGFADPSQVPGNQGSRWSFRSLAYYATSYAAPLNVANAFILSQLRIAAAEMLRLSLVRRDAQATYGRLVSLLNGEIEPDIAAPRFTQSFALPTPKIVLAGSRKRAS
jgi:hypothetical protein